MPYLWCYLPKPPCSLHAYGGYFASWPCFPSMLDASQWQLDNSIKCTEIMASSSGMGEPSHRTHIVASMTGKAGKGYDVRSTTYGVEVGVQNENEKKKKKKKRAQSLCVTGDRYGMQQSAACRNKSSFRVHMWSTCA